MAFCLIIFAYLFATLEPGIWVTDEATYLLMVKSYAVDGHYHIENGFHELFSPEFMLPGTALTSNGVEYRIYGLPAPLYVFIAAPFYSLWGVWGLNLINVLSFTLSAAALYFLVRTFGDERIALLSAVLFSFSYSVAYSQMLWPHSLSTLLVLSSSLIILTHYGKGIKGNTLVFIAGFMMAWAFGIRYPNGVFLAMQAGFVMLWMRESILPFLGGTIMPLGAIAYFNNRFFGSAMTFGYQSDYIGELALSFFGLSVIGAGALIAWRRGMRPALGRAHMIAAVFLVIGAVLFIPAVSHIFFKLISVSVYRNIGLDITYKKALLQSIPYLILVPLGLLTLKDRAGYKMAAFIGGHCIAQICMMMVMSFGGWEESLGMRYLLESVPFLIAAAAFGMARLLGDIGRRDLSFAAAVCAAATFLLADIESIHVTGGWLYAVPSDISIGLLASGLGMGRDKRIMPVFVAFLALSISYSAAVGYTDLRTMGITKNLVWKTFQRIDAGIPDGSVVVYPHNGEYPYVAPLKLEKDVTLVTAYVDRGASLPDIVFHYTAQGENIYFKENPDEAWINASRRFVDENNLTNVYFYSFRT